MKDETFATCLGMIVSTILLIVVGTVADGWALSKIWNWFMPSVFGLVSLSIWKAIGISMVFSLFTRTNSIKRTSSGKESDTFGEAVIRSLSEQILTPMFSVFMAWIIFQLAF